ncbi:MAG: NAD(P)H-dependent glycerol-3-phosphate dehydrogenase, partial [Sporomusaceae bacterium]|nr:NAD(P)H-dependent glycerol-3-phosphate dehydrogenase [Sporomusaceae bacterium]
MKIAVIGAGSWGTALAKLLSESSQAATENRQVYLWARSDNQAQAMNQDRENKTYLPGVALPDSLAITTDLAEAVTEASVIFFVNPSKVMREMAERVKPYIAKGAILVSAAKGLEAKTYYRMSEILAQVMPEAGAVVALSGPNHAEEVALGSPAATVVASANRTAAELVQTLLMTTAFRPYTNDDIIGVELGGALKNIIALCAGIAEGLGFGDNAKAALMTRGLVEIRRLGVAMGATNDTFSGMSGAGDLIVTCTSRHSRNRRAGLMLAAGQSMTEIQEGSKMVVEGIRATEAAY